MKLPTKLVLWGAGVLLVLLYLSASQWRLDLANRALKALEDQRFVDVARRAQFAQGVARTRAEIIRSLPPTLAAAVAQVKKEVPDAEVTHRLESTVTINDTAKGVETSEGGRPTSVEDEYGRFHFDLTGAVPLLTRKQLFRWDAVIVKRLNGDHEFAKSEFRELNPTTKEEIPKAGVDMAFKFDFVEEEAPTPSAFHPILVVAADLDGLGAGVEFVRWKQLSLSALGLYDKFDSTIRGAVQLGYRLKFPFLDTNISVGASYSTDRRIRPSGTVQVTR